MFLLHKQDELWSQERDAAVDPPLEFRPIALKRPIQISWFVALQWPILTSWFVTLEWPILTSWFIALKRPIQTSLSVAL